jgi:hypothetical protein
VSRGVIVASIRDHERGDRDLIRSIETFDCRRTYPGGDSIVGSASALSGVDAAGGEAG